MAKNKVIIHKDGEIMNVDALIEDKLFRTELANARKAKHITQKELSKMSGLSESCISNIETGEDSSPTLRSIIKYATALGVSISVNFLPPRFKSNNDKEKIDGNTLPGIS